MGRREIAGLETQAENMEYIQRKSRSKPPGQHSTRKGRVIKDDVGELTIPLGTQDETFERYSRPPSPLQQLPNLEIVKSPAQKFEDNVEEGRKRKRKKRPKGLSRDNQSEPSDQRSIPALESIKPTTQITIRTPTTGEEVNFSQEGEQYQGDDRNECDVVVSSTPHSKPGYVIIEHNSPRDIKEVSVMYMEEIHTGRFVLANQVQEKSSIFPRSGAFTKRNDEHERKYLTKMAKDIEKTTTTSLHYLSGIFGGFCLCTLLILPTLPPSTTLLPMPGSPIPTNTTAYNFTSRLPNPPPPGYNDATYPINVNAGSLFSPSYPPYLLNFIDPTPPNDEIESDVGGYSCQKFNSSVPSTQLFDAWLENNGFGAWIKNQSERNVSIFSNRYGAPCAEFPGIWDSRVEFIAIYSRVAFLISKVSNVLATCVLLDAMRGYGNGRLLLNFIRIFVAYLCLICTIVMTPIDDRLSRSFSDTYGGPYGTAKWFWIPMALEQEPAKGDLDRWRMLNAIRGATGLLSWLLSIVYQKVEWRHHKERLRRGILNLYDSQPKQHENDPAYLSYSRNRSISRHRNGP
ncbi:hypothetical protein BJ742DRAFT_789237 [Cladochytrium replicatum]|nr:hypothetical protein BJ742DRAFT_789237 [Cladochytrium replicatum]